MITVDDSNPTPPFEQIRGQIAGLIAMGTLTAGERLPTVRQLAADLRLAPGTVARAYAALEADALIESRRGAGTRVSASANRFPELLECATTYVRVARDRKLTIDEAIFAIRAAWGS
jgi:DNA-binding transcriptional regulator YhcF (GntR family)